MSSWATSRRAAQGGAVRQLYWNPLVWVVWRGWLVMFAGAGFARTQSGAQAALLRQSAAKGPFAQPKEGPAT